MVENAYTPNAWEAEAGMPQSETLSLNNPKSTKPSINRIEGAMSQLGKWFLV